MAANPQYNFPPPPPPPGQSAPNYVQQHPQYGFAQQPPRGGGSSRGSNRGGRGDFHGFSSHAAYNSQAPPPGAYGPQNPQPYVGPQVPSNNYPPPQWGHEQHGPPQPVPHPQQHPQSIHQPPPPIPLSAQNYHPNYAPQPYGQPSQYGPQQPPQPYQQPAQPTYGPQVPMSHQPQMGPPQGGMPLQQWSGPPQPPQPQYSNSTRGRGRGGFNASRGGHEAPLMGPPIRMGFDNDRSGEQITQAGNGYAPQYPNAHQTSPVPFSQPPYQSYPPQNFTHGGQRPPLDPNPYNSTSHNRGGGRGGSNFRGRGRGDHFRHRPHDRHNRFNGSSGSPAPAHKSAGADNDARNKKKNKKRKTNTLGLTPNGPDHEDSEEDDIDEEVRLVNLLGPDTPQLPTDIAAWIAERKARYPTKARREAAAEELRRRQEQTHGASATNDADAASKKAGTGESKLERQQRKAEKLRLQLEKAEQKIKDAMNAGSKRKRETGDNGDGDDGEDDESDDSSDSGSDDSKPEVASSRVPAPSQATTAPKAQLQRHCKYFSTGGTCGKKGKCRFVHDQEVRNQALKEKEANGGVMTLAQRLILNDTAKDDLTILKSIKYLKEKGLMSDHQNASAKKVDGDVQATQTQPPNDLAMRSKFDSHPDPSASSTEEQMKDGDDDNMKMESIDDGEV
ncbi:hypothetical protein F5884DRAFT_661403 [Xylogone sp. PMI_703]|nr:hypothetical protein F5884DRAFT_661403 [Xylogone sp. PMI_703]